MHAFSSALNTRASMQKLFVGGLVLFAALALIAFRIAPVSAHDTSGSRATAAATDRGQSADPSKKDHDNGRGNNCDPGDGHGREKKHGGDDQSNEATTCKTSDTDGENDSDAENSKDVAASTVITTSTTSSGGVNGAATAAPTAANSGGVSGATAMSTGGLTGSPQAPASTAPTGGVLGETATAGGVQLAATGLPIIGGLLGILLATIGGWALRRRKQQ